MAEIKAKRKTPNGRIHNRQNFIQTKKDTITIKFDKFEYNKSILLTNSYDPTKSTSVIFLMETLRNHLTVPYTKTGQEIKLT